MNCLFWQTNCGFLVLSSLFILPHKVDENTFRVVSLSEADIDEKSTLRKKSTGYGHVPVFVFFK